jgi:hypothetical protein
VGRTGSGRINDTYLDASKTLNQENFCKVEIYISKPVSTPVYVVGQI